jgi:hypothetical protein
MYLYCMFLGTCFCYFRPVEKSFSVRTVAQLVGTVPGIVAFGIVSQQRRKGRLLLVREYELAEGREI